MHDHLRSELDRLRDLVAQVADGQVDPAAARSYIADDDPSEPVDRRRRLRRVLPVVTGHHSLEDASVFPHLRRGDSRLAPVIDRLEEEHRSIHGVLEDVDRALVAFVSDDLGEDGAKRLHGAVDLLTDTLLSHLAYEERELVEPLARFGYY